MVPNADDGFTFWKKRGIGLELETSLSRSAAWKRLRRRLPSPYRLRGDEDHLRIEPAWETDPDSGPHVVGDEPDPRALCVTFRGSLVTHNDRVRLCGVFQEPRWFRVTSRVLPGLGMVLLGASLLAVAAPWMVGFVSRALLPGVFPSGGFWLFTLWGVWAGRRHYAREQADLEKHLRQVLGDSPGEGAVPLQRVNKPRTTSPR